jgi:hypothetical protein
VKGSLWSMPGAVLASEVEAGEEKEEEEDGGEVADGTRTRDMDPLLEQSIAFTSRIFQVA